MILLRHVFLVAIMRSKGRRLFSYYTKGSLNKFKKTLDTMTIDKFSFAKKEDARLTLI